MAAADPGPRAQLGMTLRLIAKALTVRRGRVLLALSAIALGSAIVTAFASVHFDISIKMSRELRTYGANFFVGPAETEEAAGLSAATLAMVTDAVPAERLEGASPYLYGVVRLDRDNAVLAGVEFTGLRRIAPFWQVTGSWVTVDFDERHAMIGRHLAESMEIGLGDPVTIRNPDTGFLHRVTVRGILESGEASDNYLFVNLALAQRALDRPGEVDHGMLSLVTSGLDADALAADLEQRFVGVAAHPVRKIAESEGDILGTIEGLMALVALTILVITTVCVNATLTASIMERSREIGLLKALGARNRSIVARFLAETAVLAVIGIAIGLVLGFLLAQGLGQAMFGSSIGFRAVVLPMALAIGLVSALAAAVLPIRRAVRVVPALVLRGE